MRYILRRDTAGDWGIWDTRRQIFHCTGLDVEDARTTAKNMNEENEQEIKKYIE